MRNVLIGCMIVLTVAANAQTDRHGQSGGTVEELPVPRVYHDLQPQTEIPSTVIALPADPEIVRIEAEHQARIDKLTARMDKRESAEYKRLSFEVQRIKLERELAILELMRERATVKGMHDAVFEIETAIEDLRARKDESKQIASRPVTKAAKQNTNRESKANGGLPATKESGGAK